MESITDLPLEIKILIAEQDLQIFRIFHTYDPEVRQFIDKRIDKYKKLFSKEIIGRDNFGCKIKCYILPNGSRHGLHQEWRPTGQLLTECTYKDGKLERLYQEWHYNKQLWTEHTYKVGKKEGLYQTWRFNGQLAYECTYKDGVEILKC